MYFFNQLFLLFILLPSVALADTNEITTIRVDNPQNVELIENRDFSILFLLVNDSFISSGDDDGYTHGLKVAGTKVTDYGLRITVKYAADLYTEEAESEANDDTEQFFTDETLLNVLVDNIEEGNFWYWKGGVGWQQLSNEVTDNFFYGSRQQEVVHGLLNYINEVEQPINIEEDNRKRQDNGIALDYGVGLQQNIEKERLNINFREELGGRYSSLENASFEYLQVSAKSSYQFSQNYSAGVSLGARLTKHHEGLQHAKFIGFAFNTKRFEFGIRAEDYSGDLVNYVLYNKPETDDLQLYAYFAYLGGKRGDIEIPMFFRE